MSENKHWKVALREHPHPCAGITDICDDCGFSRGDAAHTGPTNHRRWTIVREDLPVGDKGISKELGLYAGETCLARFMWAPRAKILYAHPGVSLVVNRDRSHNPQIGLYRSDTFGGPRGSISGALLSATFNAYYVPEESLWRNIAGWLRVKSLCKGWLQLGPFAVNWE